MALIKCTECGKEFSDKAPACPNCGCPTSEIVKMTPGGSVNSAVEKQMLDLVEGVLAAAREAGASFELASDDVKKLADRTNIDLFGSTARQDTSRIVEAAVSACDSLYTSYQNLIPKLDGACRPLLAKRPGPKAVRAVAGAIAWLNEESEIENNYAITFNGDNLGNAVKAKYIPSPVNLAIQGFWESEFYRFPDHAEAEAFWKKLREEHVNKAARAEMEARQKELESKRAYREWERQQAEEKKEKRRAEEEARKERHSSQADKIRERMEYARPAKAMFSSNMMGTYAYITDRGKPTLCGRVSVLQRNYDPDDISKMADLCQIAINNDGIFGLTREGRVLMNSSTDYIKKSFGYSVISSWRDIKKIACTNYCLVGLRYDGTCVATKFKSDGTPTYNGEGDVEAWRNIVDIVCGSSYTVGLKKDGTVCYCGKVDATWVDLSRSQKWTNIVLLYADYCQLIGLKKDGTLVQTGNWDLSLVSMAKDIVDITVCDRKLFVLQSDGHVIGIVQDWVEQKKDGIIVPKLNDAVAIFRERDTTLVVLKETGDLVKYESNNLQQYESNLIHVQPEPIAKLSWNYAVYQKAERERIKRKEDQIQAEKEAREAAERKKHEEEALLADRRAKNLCQHCGGELEKKLFGWKCKSCGQRKDY